MKHLILFLSFCFVAALPAQVMIGIGDSLGQSTQGAEATAPFQQRGYLVRIAVQVGAPFPLPLIRGGIATTAQSVAGRSRVDPLVMSPNLAVNGATVETILNEQADGIIDEEVDLVLAPRTGSQIEIAEQMMPSLIVCWAGNSDVLGTVTSFDQIDASQLISVVDFTLRFGEIADRLAALGADHLVFGKIPHVTNTGILMDNDDLTSFTGTDWGLADGLLTTAAVGVLLRLGLDDGSILDDPNFVLDPVESATIRDRIDAINQIVDLKAAEHGAAVADINPVFAAVKENPIQVGGITVSTKFLGGAFSLDGVHPGSFGHAVIANVFINALNDQYGTSIPPLSDFQLLGILLNDRVVDKDGDGRLSGRPFNGLLETLGIVLGITGDLNDFSPASQAFTADPMRGERFLERYRQVTGRLPQPGESRRDEAIRALKHCFGAAG